MKITKTRMIRKKVKTMIQSQIKERNQKVKKIQKLMLIYKNVEYNKKRAVLTKN